MRGSAEIDKRSCVGRFWRPRPIRNLRHRPDVASVSESAGPDQNRLDQPHFRLGINHQRPDSPNRHQSANRQPHHQTLGLPAEGTNSPDTDPTSHNHPLAGVHRYAYNYFSAILFYLSTVLPLALPTVVGLGIYAITATGSAQSVEPAARKLPTVAEIKIVGRLRVSEETIRRLIEQPVGGPLQRSVVSEDIKRIYRSGFFDDVQVSEKELPDGKVGLLFQVAERPTINAIRYEGNDELDEDDFEKVVDLRAFSVVSVPNIKRNLEKIKNLYVDEGYYLANVTYRLEPLPGNLVDVVFIADEGQEIEVKTITFLGNSKVDDDTLRSSMFTREGGFFAFLTRAGKFKREAFQQDLMRIQMTYLDRGYIHVNVGDPVVTLSPDKKSMHITIHIEEGEQYSVGAVGLTGDFIVDRAELEEMIKLKSGDIFSRETVVSDTIAIGDLYKDAGYANATISNQTRSDDVGKTVDFTYVIQKGEKVYFRFIEIQGNHSTRDRVIRRELTFYEGQLYSSTALKQSRQEVMRLGFFDDVTLTTKNTENPAFVDVIIKVKERDTGTFQLGAGFSSIENFIFTAQISKQNLFGRGQSLAFQATLSSIRSMFSISFVEPYFFDSPFTFGFELYSFDTDYSDFTRDSIGGNITWGYKFTRDLSISLTYKLEDVDVSIGGLTGRSTTPLHDLFQDGLTSSLRGTVTYDDRDNRLFPTKGWFIQGSAEWADKFLGSENLFVRLRGNVRWYTPLFWDWVFKINGNIGYITGIGGQDVPIFERFFMGGIFTVRGFERNSLGPELQVASIRDPLTPLSAFNIGGNKQLYFNTELEIPIFAALQIRAVAFLDAGQAYNDNENIDLLGLRYSAGFGFRWWSPVGPLRFEWGFPLDPREGEEPVVFEFTIGNSF